MAVENRALALRGLVGREGAARLDRTAIEGAIEHRAGFEEAYLAYRAAIYAYARRMVSNPEDAEDLTLLTFEKALRAWGRRPPDQELRPWLFRIATNSCLDELRKRQRIQWRPWESFIGLFHPSQIAPDNPESEVILQERASLVRAALDRLSPRDRAALVLREYHQMSVEEVGNTLGLSCQAAKTALYRARERLRAAYLQLGGDAPHQRGDGSHTDSTRTSSSAATSIPVNSGEKYPE